MQDRTSPMRPGDPEPTNPAGTSRPRLLVTGGTGFVGRAVIELLLRQGYCPTVIVRRAESCPSWWHEDPRIIIHTRPSLLELRDVTMLLQSIDGVVHLAGLAHVGDATAEDAFERANAETTRVLAEASKNAGVDTFIHLSSLSAITTNTSQTPISDETKPRPTTPYGRSKLHAEKHLEPLAAEGKFAVSLRAPLIVGWDAKGNWKSLQRLADSNLPLPFAALKTKRNYLGIQTLSGAIVSLVESRWSNSLSGTYCICDPEALSLPEVVACLRDGLERPVRQFPMPAIAFEALGRLSGRRRQLAGLTGSLPIDSSRFWSSFGLSPRMSIRDAMRDSGAQYRRHRHELR